MGHDKNLETINGTSLLQRTLVNLSFLSSDVIIVTANKQNLTRFDGYPGCQVVSDIYPGKGSLGGIYTGLAASTSLYNLVVASDMPFLSQDLLHYLTSLGEGYDLVVPRLGEMMEPLHAVYSKGCLAPMESMLKQDNLKIHELFGLVRVRYVSAGEIDRFDPEHRSFFNINTEADLTAARKLAREEINSD